MGDGLKVLMLNGSPRANGNIALAFHEMEKVFEENGVGYENILLGRTDIRGCIACETCRKNGKCVFDDIVNDLSAKFEEADFAVLLVAAFAEIVLIHNAVRGKHHHYGGKHGQYGFE